MFFLYIATMKRLQAIETALDIGRHEIWNFYCSHNFVSYSIGYRNKMGTQPT